MNVRPFDGFRIRPRFDKHVIIQLLKWAVPVSLQTVIFCFLAMVTQRIETRFGADAIAADKIGSQVESISWMIGQGYSSALSAFIGQNYGAKKWSRIHRGIKTSLKVMLAWMAGVTIFLWTLGPTVFSFFLPQPKLVALGTVYVRIIAFCEIFGAIECVCGGAFTGMGRTVPPAVVVLCCNGFRPLLALILSSGSLGVYGVWLAMSITAAMRGVFMGAWYHHYSKSLPNEGGVL
jgi:Na+-driven multidrug efflux pump